jgi:hypothetical protein
MSKSITTRLERLELTANLAAELAKPLDWHIRYKILNPDGTLHQTLETIIENGVVIRDDCGRPLG